MLCGNVMNCKILQEKNAFHLLQRKRTNEREWECDCDCDCQRKTYGSIQLCIPNTYIHNTHGEHLENILYSVFKCQPISLIWMCFACLTLKEAPYWDYRIRIIYAQAHALRMLMSTCDISNYIAIFQRAIARIVLCACECVSVCILIVLYIHNE